MNQYKNKFSLKLTLVSLIGILMFILLDRSTSVQAASGVTEDQINNYVNKASLDQKVGQMYVSRTPQKPGQAEHDVAKYNLGGLIVYDADLNGLTVDQYKQKMQNYQKSAQTPLLIGIDQEGGLVSRLTHSGLIPQNGDQFAFPRQQYEDAEAKQKGSGMQVVLDYAKKNATLLRSLGINWNYAPDADYSNTTNGFIYDRTFGGGSYQATADYIKQVVPAWQHDNLIAATLKHFPGYGDAADTHTGFATRNDSLNDIETKDMLPFIAGIQAGVDSVMVTHVIYDKIDSVYPASLSAKINDLIRNYCHFNGVIVTDALEMGAITDFAKSHGGLPVDVLAVKAGNDMIMTGDYATGIPEIVAAVKKGEISEEQINNSVRRILEMKNKLGLLTPDSLDPNKSTNNNPDTGQTTEPTKRPDHPIDGKEIFINNITYNANKTIAYVAGKVADEAAEGSMQISVIDPVTSKTVSTQDAVVGGKGEFVVQVPVTDNIQHLQVVADDLTYAGTNITIEGKSTDTPSNSGSSTDTTNNSDNNNTNKPSINKDDNEETSMTGVVYVPEVEGHKGWKVALLDKDGKYTGKFIATGSNWKVFAKKTIDGTTYYRIGTQEQWIPAKFANVVNDTNKPEEETLVSGVAYVPQILGHKNWKVALLDKDGNYTGKFVSTDSIWKVLAVKVINGEKMLRLGTQEQWVPMKYTDFNI